MCGCVGVLLRSLSTHTHTHTHTLARTHARTHARTDTHTLANTHIYRDQHHHHQRQTKFHIFRPPSPSLLQPSPICSERHHYHSWRGGRRRQNLSIRNFPENDPHHHGDTFSRFHGDDTLVSGDGDIPHDDAASKASSPIPDAPTDDEDVSENDPRAVSENVPGDNNSNSSNRISGESSQNSTDENISEDDSTKISGNISENSSTISAKHLVCIMRIYLIIDTHIYTCIHTWMYMNTFMPCMQAQHMHACITHTYTHPRSQPALTPRFRCRRCCK